MRKDSELTLRKQRDFARTYNKGKSQGCKYAVVIYRKNNLSYTRTAFVSSKKVGNSVERNRARRLMREAYNSFKDRVEQGYDIVFVARNTILAVGEKEVERSMFGAVRGCGLIRDKDTK